MQYARLNLSGGGAPAPTSPAPAGKPSPASENYAAASFAATPAYELESDHSENGDAETEALHAEVDALRFQIKTLNDQLFAERKSWLQERQQLHNRVTVAASSAPPSERSTPTTPWGAPLQSPGPSATLPVPSSLSTCSLTLEDSARLESRAGSYSFCSSTGFSATAASGAFAQGAPPSTPHTPGPAGASTSSSATPAEVAGLQQELTALKAQLEQAQTQAKVKAAKWSAEQRSLQHQVTTLMRMAGEAADPEELAEQVRQLEDEKSHLQAQLTMMAANYKAAAMASSTSHYAASPRSHFSEQLEWTSGLSSVSVSARPSSGSGSVKSASACDTTHGDADPSCSSSSSPATATSPVPSPLSATTHNASSGPAGAAGDAWALTMTGSVSLPQLLAEKAALERELQHYKEECVAVPKAQYAQLATVHSQKAFLVNDHRTVCEELAEVARQRDNVEAELDVLKKDFVMIAPQEYERLQRYRVSAQARDAKAAAEASATVKMSSEQHRILMAAIKERDMLAQQLAALDSQQQSSQDAASQALVAREAELRELKLQAAVAASDLLAAQQALAASEERCAELELLQSQLTATETMLANAQQDQAMFRHKRRAMEIEINALSELVQKAKASRDALALELGAAKDQAVAGAQALAEAQAARVSAEAAAQASQREVARLTQELVAVKVEMAGAREMEVLYKHDVFRSKVRLHGLPAEQCGSVAALEGKEQSQQ